MTKPKTRITITIDPEVLEQLDRVCRDNHRSRSNAIETLIMRTVKK